MISLLKRVYQPLGRHDVRSTIVTGQLPVSGWHEMIGDPTLADAILDRLVHAAYRLELRGGSMRQAQRPAEGVETLDGPSPQAVGDGPTATDGPGRPRRPKGESGESTS